MLNLSSSASYSSSQAQNMHRMLHNDLCHDGADQQELNEQRLGTGKRTRSFLESSKRRSKERKLECQGKVHRK